jgi:glucose-6-phosphate 1-dehydrogenase
MNNEVCDSVSIVIFGASGDLTKRKLIPALYNLFIKKRLCGNFQILGTSRSEFTHDEFRQKMHDAVQEFSESSFDAAKWDDFSKRIYYLAGDVKSVEDYNTLDSFLREHEGEVNNRLYYLSTAPSLYEPILHSLQAAQMAKEDNGWRRIIVEKPFGTDLESAKALNAIVHEGFQEHQVYRIDHYLGKETAQNLLFLRFANTVFEPIWNRNYISNVQITVAETVDVGTRGDYYDQAGVLRDMFQNHLMQLLALTAMEPPISLNADHLRDEKAKTISAIRDIRLADTVRAQYDGYLQSKGVNPDSRTATYAALKLYIDNWRWQGVPFYLRSGKALKRKSSEIAIQFKHPPLPLFKAHRSTDLPNTLSICIQPDEGIHLGFEAKLPDERIGKAVEMEFHYADTFGKGAIPEAYERLLLDALLGDAALFAREDEIIASWRLIDSVLEGWAKSDQPIAHYKSGTWGPSEADELLDMDGFRWHLSCEHCDD